MTIRPTLETLTTARTKLLLMGYDTTNGKNFTRSDGKTAVILSDGVRFGSTTSRETTRINLQQWASPSAPVSLCGTLADNKGFDSAASACFNMNRKASNPQSLKKDIIMETTTVTTDTPTPTLKPNMFDVKEAKAAKKARAPRKDKGVKKTAAKAPAKKAAASKKAAAPKKAIPKPGGVDNRMVPANLEHYVKSDKKTPAGNPSIHCGDDLATKLAGKSLDEVYELAAKKTGDSIKELKAKYGHLNVGLQRMSIGNRIRGSK